MSTKYLVPIIASKEIKYIILNEDVPWQEKLLDYSNSAIAINLTQKYGYELLTKSILCQFWAGLLEQVTPVPNTPPRSVSLSTDEDRVKRAIIYIESHHMEPITLEDIASSIHLSKSECCRCFKRSLSMTPFDYLLRYRIFQATILLKSSDQYSDSISALASAVGFNNISYFNKLFKKYLNITPSEYKKILKNGPDSVYTTLGIPVPRGIKK